MKRKYKIGLLFLTLLPIIIVPIFLFIVIGGAIRLDGLENPDVVTPFYVGSIVFWAILIGLTSTVTWIYFLVHAIQNKDIETVEKVVWVLLFFFFGFFSKIIYFFARVWNSEERISTRNFRGIQPS